MRWPKAWYLPLYDKLRTFFRDFQRNFRACVFYSFESYNSFSMVREKKDVLSWKTLKIQRILSLRFTGHPVISNLIHNFNTILASETSFMEYRELQNHFPRDRKLLSDSRTVKIHQR